MTAPGAMHDFIVRMVCMNDNFMTNNNNAEVIKARKTAKSYSVPTIDWQHSGPLPCARGREGATGIPAIDGATGIPALDGATYSWTSKSIIIVIICIDASGS